MAVDISVFSTRNFNTGLPVENTEIENNYVDYFIPIERAFIGNSISLGLSNNYRNGTYKE